MKKKFALLLATTAIVLMGTTNVFGYSIVIEGEENTGQSYPIVTKTYYDYGDNGEEIYYDVPVHQIPKAERFKVADYDITDSTYIGCYSIVFGNRCNSSGINGSCALLYDCFDSHTLKDGYHNFKDMDYKPSTWLDNGCFFTVDDVGYQDWDYISDIDPEPFFFQFVDIPLLRPDIDDEEKPDKPVASDSNATNSNASRPNSGRGSSSGGSSRKVATDSRNTDGIWIQDTNGWWFKKLDGSYPKNEWIMVKDVWYHFNEQGYMQTGWLDLNNVNYYLNPDGAMVSNDWSFQDGKWYYFDTTGAMQTNKWVQWKELWYYLTSDGSMAVDMITPDGYTVNSNGGWVQ